VVTSNAIGEFRQDLVNLIYKALDRRADVDEILKAMREAERPTVLINQVFESWRKIDA
jgi:hypothetical protein